MSKPFRISLASGLVALALSVSSCAAVPVLLDGADAPNNEPAPTSTYNPMDEDSSDPSEPTEEETTAVDPDSEFQFGDKVIYDDGLEVTLSKLKGYKPSEYSSHGDEKNFVVFNVTIKNGTSANYDPSMFSMTATTGDVESEQVFDSEKDVMGSPSTKVRKGRSVTFKTAFGVKKGKEFVVEVSPGYPADDGDFDMYDSVLYVGTPR